ncbi:MAG: AsmA family protein [Pseudomonadales bacterium]|nr:AsmA family protein [Pseudomonadales bacterium]
MRTPVKIAAIIAALGAAVFLAVVVAVTLIFEPNDYRPLLVGTVERATGRTFELTGDLGLAVLPCCSVTLGKGRLGNPADFPDRYSDDGFVAFDSAALGIRIWPLLTRRQLEIGTVRLDGLDLDLIRLADGRTNWTFATPAAEPTATDPESTALQGIRMESATLRDARLRYRDVEAGQDFSLRDLRLSTETIEYRERIMIAAPNLTAQLFGGGLPEAGIPLEFHARSLAAAADGSALDLAGLGFAFGDSRLTGSVSGSDIPAGGLRFDLALDRLDTALFEASGAAPGASARDTAATTIPFTTLEDLRAQGTLGIGILKAGGMEFRDVVVALDSTAGPLSIDLSGRTLGGRVALTGNGNTRGRDAHLAGNVEFDGLVPRTLLGDDYRTAEPGVLGRLSGTSQWRLGTRSLALDRLDWQLDDSRIAGRIAIEDFDRVATRFDLSVDRIDLDAYLPPTPEPSQERTDQVAPATEIPVELIRGLELEGRLNAGRLRLARLDLEDARAEVRATRGVLRLQPLTATLYGGAYRGALTIDATGDTAAVALDQALTDVQVGDLLRARYGRDVLAGSASLALTGSGSGLTTRELLRGLSGNVDLNLADGAYRGADLLYEFQRARALFRNEAAPTRPASPETPIRAMQIVGTVTEGVLRSDRINLETPYLRLGGKGGLDLVDLVLDYRLDAEVLRAAEGIDGKLADLLGNTIPLTLTGPVTSPRVGIDLKDMLTGRVRDTLEQRARDALLDRLGGRQQPPADAAAPAAPDEPATDTPPPATDEREPSTRDLLRRGLRDLLAPRTDEGQQ